MSNITDAVLATTLKELISDGIVARQSYDEIPPESGILPYRKRQISNTDFAKYL